jgi:hypothetical protein
MASPIPEAAPSPTERFLPTSWSAETNRLAGIVASDDGSRTRIGLYNLATRQYASVPSDRRPPLWVWPVWLADGRRLIVRWPEGIELVNADTGDHHSLIPIGGMFQGMSAGASHDNRWISYTETATEGDIWMGTLKQ